MKLIALVACILLAGAPAALFPGSLQDSGGIRGEGQP